MDRDRVTPFVNQRTVILDGVVFAPGEFQRPSGALTWVVTREDSENGTVHAFTSRESAREFMRQVMNRELGRNRENGPDLATAAVTGCTHTDEWAYFNKDVGCGGSADLYLYPGNQYSNLDFDGWNNRISCVYAACIDAWTTLYSCRNFQMYSNSSCADPEALFVYPGVIISDLNSTSPSFNNRTSSIRFCTYYPTCN